MSTLFLFYNIWSVVRYNRGKGVTNHLELEVLHYRSGRDILERIEPAQSRVGMVT